MKRIMTTTKFFLAALAMSATSLAMANLAGSVVRVNGVADAIDASGKSRALSAGSEVKVGDTVSLKDGAGIQIQMKDGALVALADESLLKVKAYQFEEASGAADKIDLAFEKGRFRTITGDATKSNYQMSVRGAIVKIKGTTYDIKFGAGDPFMYIILREGLPGSVMVFISGVSELLEPGKMVKINTTDLSYEVLDAEEDAVLDALLPYLTEADSDFLVPDLDVEVQVSP